MYVSFYFSFFMMIWLHFDANLFEREDDKGRKNRFKVYGGLYCMYTENFKMTLLRRSLYNMFNETFILYTVLMSIVALDDDSLKEKVLEDRYQKQLQIFLSFNTS